MALENGRGTVNPQVLEFQIRERGDPSLKETDEEVEILTLEINGEKIHYARRGEYLLPYGEK